MKDSKKKDKKKKKKEIISVDCSENKVSAFERELEELLNRHQVDFLGSFTIEEDSGECQVYTWSCGSNYDVAALLTATNASMYGYYNSPEAEENE